MSWVGHHFSLILRLRFLHRFHLHALHRNEGNAGAQDTAVLRRTREGVP